MFTRLLLRLSDLYRRGYRLSKEPQTCNHCKVTKDLDHFPQRIDEQNDRICNSCISIKKIEEITGEKLKHTDTNRTCYKCHRFLVNDEFTMRKDGTYYSACKDCNKHHFAQRRIA